MQRDVSLCGVDDRVQPTTGEIVILVAGAVMLLASFLHFSAGRSSWSTPWFPIVTLLPVYGALMAAEIVVHRVINVRLPARVAGFTWDQMLLALGVMAALMAIAWMFTDTPAKQIGYWFEISGGIVLAVGASMTLRERNAL